MVAAVSKDGILYLVDAHNFGGMGGQLAMLTLATGGAMIIHTTPAAYATAQGMHVVLTVNTGAQCTGTGANGKAVMSVLIPAGSPPAPKVAWCMPVTNASLGFPASPMATTTDGTSNAIVWFMNGTKLMGVDGDTGETIFDGGGSGRRLRRRAQVDRANRGEGPHRRRGRQPPLLLVAALSFGLRVQLPSRRSMNVCITAGFSVDEARPICAARRASGGPPSAIRSSVCLRGRACPAGVGRPAAR